MLFKIINNRMEKRKSRNLIVITVIESHGGFICMGIVITMTHSSINYDNYYHPFHYQTVSTINTWYPKSNDLKHKKRLFNNG